MWGWGPALYKQNYYKKKLTAVVGGVFYTIQRGRQNQNSFQTLSKVNLRKRLQQGQDIQLSISTIKNL
jgi:hypothetical protein